MTSAPARTAEGRPARAVVQDVTRRLVGALRGVALVPASVSALLAAPLSRGPARTVAAWDARRLTALDGRGRAGLPRDRRLVGLLAVETLLGLLAAAVVALIVAGVAVVGGVLVGAATGGPVPLLDDAPPGSITWTSVAEFALPGALLLFLAVCGLAGTTWLSQHAWGAFARPGAGELERQVERLHTTLADVVAAVDTERRRIERDLHDGVQQRVVALSLLLARAERAGDEAERAALSGQARAQTQQILDDLRDVAWRVYPAMLARDGLATALEALRDRTPIPVRLRVTGTDRAGQAAETAAYFVASEAVTNAIKHARASRIDIEAARLGDRLVLTVRDDGVGGADPAGSGLAGVASRVAAGGGRLRIDSPPGGPTTIDAELPCG